MTRTWTKKQEIKVMWPNDQLFGSICKYAEIINCILNRAFGIVLQGSL